MDELNNNSNKVERSTALDGKQVTLILLAGGQAKRMGGCDKGLALFGGRPLIESVLERVVTPECTVVISANRNHESYRQYALEVIADVIPGYCGPLAGIASGLACSRTELAVTVPCDCPFVPREYVQRMKRVFEQDPAVMCAAVIAQGVKEPVFMMLRSSLQANLLSYIEQGGRKVGQWLEQNHVRWVEFEDLAAFDNLNTVEDIQLAEGDRK